MLNAEFNSEQKSRLDKRSVLEVRIVVLLPKELAKFGFFANEEIEAARAERMR
jgi:hypothetical protein